MNAEQIKKSNEELKKSLEGIDLAIKLAKVRGEQLNISMELNKQMIVFIDSLNVNYPITIEEFSKTYNDLLVTIINET